MLKSYFSTYFAKDTFLYFQLHFHSPMSVSCRDLFFFRFFLMWLTDHWIDMFGGHTDINQVNDLTVASMFFLCENNIMNHKMKENGRNKK